MERKGSAMRGRRGAGRGGPRARFERRSSSVGKSTRLIIVGSRVRIPPPLPTTHPQHPKVTHHGESEVRADEAAFEHWDDRSYRPWEDDVDGGDYEGSA